MRRAVGILATAAVAALVLSGCSPPSAEPVSLTVSVYQLRSDVAIRGAQIEISNPTSRGLTITSASFSSAWFAERMLSPSAPAELPAKRTIDFRIELATARCARPTADPIVRISYTEPDGTRGQTAVVPRVPFDSLSQVHAEDCAHVAFEQVATIVVSPTLRFDPPTAPDGKRAALIDVTLTPTGAPGSVTLDTSEDTTLLAQREGTIRTIGLTISAASPPTTVTLDYVPAGCLQHRVAEDKVGTLLPLRVDVGGAKNALFLFAVPGPLKAELFDWVGSYCGW